MTIMGTRPVSNNKKRRRGMLRVAVFKRDDNRCRRCGATGCTLDPHHITPRVLMPNGGYVPENIISLCEKCHRLAEAWLQGDAVDAREMYAPSTLYALIDSSYEQAVQAAKDAG